MIAIGMLILLAGYSATYVAAERLRGDKRTVAAIVKGTTGDKRPIAPLTPLGQ